MSKRDYVMLAHVYEHKRQTIAGWLASIKLDGIRAWWDGARSRGIAAYKVPYCNTEKDSRYVTLPICTGLFSRYGNIVNAPDWFLDELPNYPLDGELWIGNTSFQALGSVIKKLYPDDDEWKAVKYMVFDSPAPEVLFMDGDIRIQGYKKNLSGCFKWWNDGTVGKSYTESFEQTFAFLNKNLTQTDNLKLHEQIHLPFSTDRAVEEMMAMLEEVTNAGGEGLILRKPSSMWTPKRSYDLLKVKKYLDSEAVVSGYTTGRETDKGSKLLGLMGALICTWNGKRFELSGFTEVERILDSKENRPLSAFTWASENPGKEVPSWITNPNFPRGSKVTFRYRELTDDGIPKEARFHRSA